MKNFIKRNNIFSLIGRLAHDNRAVEKAMSITPFFYLFALYLSISYFFSGQLFNFPPATFIPTFPIFWARSVDFHTAVLAVEAMFVVGVFLAVLFYKHRAFRIIGFIGIIEYNAFTSSFGTRDHGWTLLVAIAFFLMFLPDIWKKAESTIADRKRFLFIFWAAAAVLFLSYALAGTGKLIGALGQISAGVTNIFSFDSGALHVADWSFHTDGVGLMGAYIIGHPLVGWFGIVGIFLLQIFSWFAAFFPRLYRTWGALLILSHVAIFLAMGIPFIDPVFLIGLFLIESPFSFVPVKKER